MRAWAAPPTLHIAGLRAIVRINTRNSGFTCDQRTTARHWCAQNADHFATSSPLSAFFTEVVCNVGTTPPQVAASSPPIGGNCTTRGSDTPTTRRQPAPHAAKTPPPAWRTPGAGEPGRSAREQRQGAAIARLLARGLRQSTTPLAQQEPHLAASGQNSPCSPLLAACAVQNSPRSPKMAQFGMFCPHRESFVPLCSTKHQAGRILYRTRGRVTASHDSTPGPTSAEGTGGSGGVWRARRVRRVRRARAGLEPQEPTTVPVDGRKTTARQISHAIRLDQISTNPENVAIPTMQIQYLNKLRGNCMRN